MYLHLLFMCLGSVFIANQVQAASRTSGVMQWCADGLVSAYKDLCTFPDYLKAYDALSKELGLLDSSNAINHMRPMFINDGPSDVNLDLFVTALTNVNENAQTISTQIRLVTTWHKGVLKSREIPNGSLWVPSEFCGIFSIIAEKDFLWTPDIAIMESIKTEFAAVESPYVKIDNSGLIKKVDILSLTTSCSMDLYKFPFDTQICKITFQSLVQTEEIRLLEMQFIDSDYEQSLQIPGEWILLNISKHVNQDIASQVIFQVTIKRIPVLYIINLIFPVFCFLVLDVASFFIKASEAEKLGFKVTLLLSLSVLLQILNDRLASTVSEIPLIGIYCCAIFVLIGVSILETIFVNILICKEEETETATTVETRSDSGQDDGVIDLHNPIDTVTSGNEESTYMRDTRKRASLCWTRTAKIIDVIFIVLYIITVIVFLTILGKRWFLS